MSTVNYWGTFYGRQTPISQISHQHLSNILWYYELVTNLAVTPLIQAEIDERFGGIRLPYKPLHSFTYEIDALYDMGYITDKISSDIIVDGKWVGRLEYR
jgi:hypothetical protein